MNQMKVVLLMGLLSVMLVFLGGQMAGPTGALIFLLIALAMNLFSYYYSDKMVIKMTKSKEVNRNEAPELYNTVARLAQRAGLPMPRLYITPSSQPNAFATGRNPHHSAVAVTEGLLQVLNPAELEGVLAHELAHIKNRDILVGTIAAAFAGAISMIANVAQWSAIFGGFNGNDEEGGSNMVGILLLAILAPIAALIVQMAISRSREYLADETGAAIAGNPRGLSGALLKLERAASHQSMDVNPAASHMFIVNPLKGAAIARLFSTHPPIAERVERLERMR